MTRTHVFDGGIIGRSNGSPVGDAFMRSMIELQDLSRKNQELATKVLRARGVKLAHANDGWVDREKKSIIPPSYRLFDDGPAEGDLIAIGSANCDGWLFQLAMVTKITQMLFGSLRYNFEMTGEIVSNGQSPSEK